MNDIKKTQHYSINKLLLDGLISFVPKNSYIIEPFYGQGDLVKDFFVSEYYDIDFNKDSEHYRDTLLNPPDYTNKWVITNPPYLAKNKATDKTLFNIYPYDDLYKIAISTLKAAAGGILIIPINFFADERSKNIRKEFFKNFTVQRLNVFLNSMFENTDYNVCSFFFKRKEKEKEKQDKNIVPLYVYENDQIIKQLSITLYKDYDWRLGGDFFYKLKEQKPLFGRITEKKRDNPTHINIICIDKVNDPLHFYYSDEYYYGKESDRNLATLSSEIELSEELTNKLITEANSIINKFRKDTYNLSLTNYRDRNRKRIGFTEAYQIMTLAYYNIINNDN